MVSNSRKLLLPEFNYYPADMIRILFAEIHGIQIRVLLQFSNGLDLGIALCNSNSPRLYAYAMFNINLESLNTNEHRSYMKIARVRERSLNLFLPVLVLWLTFCEGY